MCEGGGRRESHCERVDGGGLLVMDGSETSGEEGLGAAVRRYIRAEGEAIPFVTSVRRIVATAFGGIS